METVFKIMKGAVLVAAIAILINEHGKSKTKVVHEVEEDDEDFEFDDPEILEYLERDET